MLTDSGLLEDSVVAMGRLRWRGPGSLPGGPVRLEENNHH